jgi:hypothetical protein
MADSPTSGSVVASLAPRDYFTPEAPALCARIKHKSELTDDEMLMLATAAAQAVLARYRHPGERSARYGEPAALAA